MSPLLNLNFPSLPSFSFLTIAANNNNQFNHIIFKYKEIINYLFYNKRNGFETNSLHRPNILRISWSEYIKTRKSQDLNVSSYKNAKNHVTNIGLIKFMSCDIHIYICSTEYKIFLSITYIVYLLIY